MIMIPASAVAPCLPPIRPNALDEVTQMRRFGLLMRKFLLALLLLGMVAGAAYGLWHWRTGSDGPARYRTEKVQRGRVASLINASGTVVPEEVIDVGAQVAGKIVA